MAASIAASTHSEKAIPAMRYSGLDNQRGLQGSPISTTIASPASPAQRVIYL